MNQKKSLREKLRSRIAIRRKRKRERAATASPSRSMASQIGYAIDHAISVIAPVMAAKRLQARHMAEFREIQYRNLQKLSGRSFDGARDDEHRVQRWSISGLSPNSALEEDIRSLQDRCADLYRNNTVANSAIEGRVSNEVGIGIHCQPRVVEVKGKISAKTAEIVNRDISSFYKRWSEDGVDVSRQLSLPQFQKQVNRTFACFGEAFVQFKHAPYRGPMSLAMELIAPERIETPPEFSADPTVVMGIKYQGKVAVGYYVRDIHPGDAKQFDYTYEYVPRFDPLTQQPRMVHVFEPMFPEQSRGLPWLASVMNRIKDLDDMFEAELVNKQVEACLGVFISGGGSTDDSPEAQAARNAARTASDGKRIEEISPGSVNYVPEDTTVSTIDPSRPGSTFAPFVELALRSIASALNYPYELLAKNFFRTTYSSGRLAMLDGRMGFRMRTQTIKDMFLSKLHQVFVYELVMTDSMAQDVIIPYSQEPWMFEWHIWRGRDRALLDPEKENKGHGVGIDYEIESRTDILGERGIEIVDHEAILLTEGQLQIDREVKLALYRQEQEKKAGLQPGESIPPEIQQPQKGAWDVNKTRNNDPGQEPKQEPKPSKAAA